MQPDDLQSTIFSTTRTAQTRRTHPSETSVSVEFAPYLLDEKNLEIHPTKVLCAVIGNQLPHGMRHIFQSTEIINEICIPCIGTPSLQLFNTMNETRLP